MSKTQTTGIYGHFNIGLTFLKAMIEENGNHNYIVAEDGKSVSDEEALRMIDDDLAHGKVCVAPNCPTPRADGSCPTHRKIEPWCITCGEPKSNHSNGFCAGQPLDGNDEFPKGYTPTKYVEAKS